MQVDYSLRTTFGKVSSLYDKSRIAYPKELIDNIIRFSKLKEDAKILDVGCGSGKTTLLFAERGFEITGLDISKELIAIAKKKCQKFPKINFVVGSFEDARFSNENFDLIISGQAWHWVKPEERYEKAHQILKENGTLALFWSYQQNELSAFLQDKENILKKHLGKNLKNMPLIKNYTDFSYEELKKNKWFKDVEKHEFFGEIEFSRRKYVDLILTYSGVLALSKKEQEDLAANILKLSKKYPEPLIIPYKYVLILAKKNYINHEK